MLGKLPARAPWGLLLSATRSPALLAALTARVCLPGQGSHQSQAVPCDPVSPAAPARPAERRTTHRE